MKVISFINQKGGVGKTTTTLHTASFLASKKFKVLMIDLDPQTDLSKSIGIFDSNKTVNDFLQNDEKLHVNSIHKNLDLLAGYKDLEKLSLKRDSIKKKLTNIKGYDFILIDCQPKKIVEGIVTINEVILCATDYIVIPLDANANSVTGANDFITSIQRIKGKYNSSLKILGMLFSIVDIRERIFTDYYNALKKQNSDLVFNSFIRKDTKLKHASAIGQTIFEFDNTTRASNDFREFGKELLLKLEK